MFDCLHDMGDPRGCARHVRGILKPDGTWMIVEPIAADNPADNVGNPVSRLYYNASTMICVPTSLAQEVGEALGAQAGEAKLTEVLSEAGFRPRPARDRGPVQHGSRSAAVTAGINWASERARVGLRAHSFGVSQADHAVGHAAGSRSTASSMCSSI